MDILKVISGKLIHYFVYFNLNFSLKGV